MKKIIIATIFIGLGLSSSLSAPPSGRKQKIISALLPTQFAQFKKSLACTRSNKKCTSQEVRNAQILWASLVSGLLLFTSLATKKSFSWWYNSPLYKEKKRKEGLEQLIIGPGDKADYEKEQKFFTLTE